MKRLYTAFVTVFWIVMMGFLFNKEVLPAFIIASHPGYKIDITKDLPMRESWMGIYFKDKRIGFSNTVASQDVDSGKAGYRINEIVFLKLNILGEDKFIRIKGGSFFSENYILKNFYYKLASGDYKINISGRATGNGLRIEIDTGSEKIEKSVLIKSNTLVSNSIAPFLLFKKLDVNKKLDFEVFDPISMSANKVTIKKTGTEVIKSGGNSIQADVFEIDCYGIKTKSWMTRDGDILREESGLGFTMLKENPKDAMDIGQSVAGSGRDMLSEFSLVCNVDIQDPRNAVYLKIEKDSSYVEIHRDAEPELSKILLLPIQDIVEEFFVQSKDERIIKLAKEIVGSEKNSWLASKMILRWVYGNLKKAPTLSIPSAVDVLTTREGDCNEHTVLFTALARSIGIPAKMIAGLVYLDGAFYYHAWPKVYVGEWISMDPALGQDIADATHIPLIEGGVKEQLGLIKIIGSLKIKVIEYR